MEFLYRFRPDKDYEFDTLRRGEVIFNSVENFDDKKEFSALFEIFTAEQFADMDISNSESEDKFFEYCIKEYGSVKNWLNNVNNSFNNFFKNRIEEQLRCY